MRRPIPSLAIAFAALLAAASVTALAPGRLEAQRGGSAGNDVYDPSLYAGLRYRMIGPYRGGRSTTVEGVEGEPFTYFKGTTGGGVWKTTDAGLNWINVSDGFFGGDIGAVEVADSDPNVIYVGTGSACIRGDVSPGHGVYKSTDGGETWRFIGLPEAGQIGRIAVHPGNPDLLYLAVLGHAFGKNPERGVYRSKDGGDTWEQVLFVSDSTGAVDLSMNPRNPREIYAAMWRAERKPWTHYSGSFDSGLYKTMDGGDTWVKLGGGLPEGLVGKIAVTVSPANPNRVWALVQAEPDGGVYRSDDGGKTWTYVNAERTLRQRAFYYTHMHADPLDENTVYALNSDMWRSVDGGHTFQEVDVPHGDVHDLWINPEQPKLMIVGNDGGGQVSVNGGDSWSTMYNHATAQFYRVAVDDRFPYRVYGAQQDNSTMSVPSWWSGGLSPEQFWYEVGGGESGHIAIHPENPNITFATSFCCGGRMDYMNQETGQVRDVIVYPHTQNGPAMKDLKYRFQWNNPVRFDPHEPNVVYHGSQFVLRSRDLGQTWEEISPDLTTNDITKQQHPGGPINYDITGVENYNTIFALELSPDTPGEIWVGSDDGLVHLTRDGGASWTNITPGGMPQEGTVNAIDISRHRPGKAYVTVYNYRMDDFRPYVFRTENYGGSWELLTDGTNGIPEHHYVRVVREDPEREGLLYAGTEFGMYVSFDDGDHWQTLQLNLPIVPVADLQVHRGDLVVATHGRSFWIMDDLTPLRQIDAPVAAAPFHLFTPADAYRATRRRSRGERWPENRPEGAFIYYSLREGPQRSVTLEILDSAGDLVRTFSNGEAAVRDRWTLELSAKPGMHRVLWDLTYPGPDQVEDAVIRAYDRGYRAVPGNYAARLTVDGQSQTRSFEVLMDPRLQGVTLAHLQEQFELAAAIKDTIDQMAGAVRKLRQVREDAKWVAQRAERLGQGTELLELADDIAAKLGAVEDGFMQLKKESRNDVRVFPPRLDDDLFATYEHVVAPDARPNQGAYDAFNDYSAQWSELRDLLQAVIDTEVAEFNRRARGLNVAATASATPRRSVRTPGTSTNDFSIVR